MTELDTALMTMRQDVKDEKNQSKYYDLFLNATFFVPTEEEPLDTDGGEVAPLVIEADGSEYLMLFDTRQRLYDWAGAQVPCVEVPGHVLATMAMGELHWALNVGTDYSKRFLPGEIAWLREVVENCDAGAAGETGQQ